MRHQFRFGTAQAVLSKADVRLATFNGVPGRAVSATILIAELSNAPWASAWFRVLAALSHGSLEPHIRPRRQRRAERLTTKSIKKAFTEEMCARKLHHQGEIRYQDYGKIELTHTASF